MTNWRQNYAMNLERVRRPKKSCYCANDPSDAKCVSQFFHSLNAKYPRVKAVSWFQCEKEDGKYLLQRRFQSGFQKCERYGKHFVPWTISDSQSAQNG